MTKSYQYTHSMQCASWICFKEISIHVMFQTENMKKEPSDFDISESRLIWGDSDEPQILNLLEDFVLWCNNTKLYRQLKRNLQKNPFFFPRISWFYAGLVRRFWYKLPNKKLSHAKTKLSHWHIGLSCHLFCSVREILPTVDATCPDARMRCSTAVTICQ